VSTKFKKEKITLKPRIYWRRNQDMYLFVRSNPAIYRNLHQTNKIGVEFNASYNSSIGVTGFGVDIAKVYLSSNNLGARNRFMTTLFLEHQFKFANNKIDVTPGVAVNYFSDFKFHAFPGIDVGYKINEQIKLYGNGGYTYRVPTYTDLYYSDPTTLGNEDLDPEEAIAGELGMKYRTKKIEASIALFNRYSKKLIDYVKENESDLWQATNIRDLNTKGVELNATFFMQTGDLTQSMSAGYTFLDDDLKSIESNFSRYSINSLKHDVVLGLHGQATSIPGKA